MSILQMCSLLGWTSRQQFEETWMCLLGVISASQTSTDALANHTIAIEAITKLLISSLLVPYPGNPIVSKYLHIPRNKKIEDQSIVIRKLQHIQDLIATVSQNNTKTIFNISNLEYTDSSRFMYGQISSSFLHAVSNSQVDKSVLDIYEYKQKCLEASGIDLESCLQFLIDLYSQMLDTQSTTNTQLVHIILKSLVSVSDLFSSQFHHEWTLQWCLNLYRVIPLEDELSHQYIALLSCKSAAVVMPEPDILAEIRSILHSSLRSVFPAARTAAIHGLIYLIENLLQHENSSTQQNHEVQLFYELAREYAETVFAEVEQGGYHHCLYHHMSVFSLAFFLLEHFDGVLQEGNQNPSILCSALFVLEQTVPNLQLYEAVSYGLERLIILDKISKPTISNVVQLTMKKIKHEHITMMLPALRLMVTCMYKGASEQLSKSENLNCTVENDLDVIVESVEKTTAIFERIRKSNTYEAKILCSVLSTIFNDLFPPSEILTKIVGEFFAVNHPHGQLIAGIVFQVFQRACFYKQLDLLQAWLVCSLPNFTTKLSPSISAWCLTCIFIGASENEFLINFFPYVQSRMGKMEYEDKKMLCIAANDFYRNLTKEQKASVIETFTIATKTDRNSVFVELLDSLDKT